ncbi:MAG: malto-oligosyltrehalose synthase [Nitrospira sp.]|jgi:(1->4)-alpha-D-glucan 1-alpha-D-glucosylmutase|uniref:malto-oligosyltrehalose synthase n=1 Tax=Nitrospira sp. ND1 TaxID=1658518 RepID=UPI0009B948CA|nr:malto-oligosyltrehalose synthase [Nitrospira sp. ND1]SLM42725.1 Maltooligosyl trehalose synthase [Nitrospira sp. ND1]
MPRIPVSTYRLQFNHTFTFKDAAALVPYLHALGITDCYASSLLKAAPESMHGYDLVDPGTLNPELGSDEDFALFADALKQHDMGLLVDVVPNHMGIGTPDNRWWWDVLENGPGARYAAAFDVDWTPLKRELEDKVLLPILGEQYGTVLENQEIRLQYEEGGFLVSYYRQRLPLAPTSWASILSFRLTELIELLGSGHAAVLELQSILTALSHLPPGRERVPEKVAERYRETEIVRRRLAAVIMDCREVHAHVLANVAAYNGTKGLSASFDKLDALLNEQSYRLASWRVASEEINYRRFFDVNELAAIRTEEESVFTESHRLIFRLLKRGIATGLRIDHVDGLYDPEHYLQQLQAWAAAELPRERDKDTPSLFVLVEKILGEGEQLPRSWPVAGTTGYDFLNLVNGLFVRADQEQAMEALYARFTGERRPYRDLVYQSKKLIMRASMSSELNVLGHQLNRLSERDRHYRDFTLNSLTHAVREIIACFPVYRSYLTTHREAPLDRDQAYIVLAVARAKRRNPTLNGQIFDFVRDLLVGKLDPSTGLTKEEQIRFVTKFQQTTGPVMAKGVEDTAFYVYNRLISLNEVGGDPAHFGSSVEAFHEAIRERRAGWPYSMSATSTHDTKRGEDVRARINVLPELRERWSKAIARWARLNRRYRSEVEEAPAPDRNDEYLLYQTLVGAWPLMTMDEVRYEEFVTRIERYMIKAAREAKTHTSWINPHPDYEAALCRFIRAILSSREANPFLNDFLPFQAMVARYGMYNGLSQLLVKVAAPGVPDCYQGAELWELNLVDPDNRRPVEYALRARMLKEFDRAATNEAGDRIEFLRCLAESWQDGRLKLFILQAALRHRRAYPDLYLDGDYVPLNCEGPHQFHLCAFARLHQDQAVVAVAPRFMAGSAATRDEGRPDDTWRDTWLTVPSWKAGSAYEHLFTGERFETVNRGERQVLPVGQVLKHCPVALLIRSD